MLIVHREPNHVPSEFLSFSKPLDALAYQSLSNAENDALVIPDLSFLRVELVRIRSGMSDFIMRLATPRVPNKVNSNTMVTLRANRSHGTTNGSEDLANTVVKEMLARKDETHRWDAADKAHLAQMLFPFMRFFVGNTSVETMQFTTEALN